MNWYKWTLIQFTDMGWRSVVWVIMVVPFASGAFVMSIVAIGLCFVTLWLCSTSPSLHLQGVRSCVRLSVSFCCETRGVGASGHIVRTSIEGIDRPTTEPGLSRPGMFGDFLCWKDESVSRPSRHPENCGRALSGWSLSKADYQSEFEAIKPIAKKRDRFAGALRPSGWDSDIQGASRR